MGPVVRPLERVPVMSGAGACLPNLAERAIVAKGAARSGRRTARPHARSAAPLRLPHENRWHEAALHDNPGPSDMGTKSTPVGEIAGATAGDWIAISEAPRRFGTLRLRVILAAAEYLSVLSDRHDTTEPRRVVLRDTDTMQDVIVDGIRPREAWVIQDEAWKELTAELWAKLGSGELEADGLTDVFADHRQMIPPRVWRWLEPAPRERVLVHGKPPHWEWADPDALDRVVERPATGSGQQRTWSDVRVRLPLPARAVADDVPAANAGAALPPVAVSTIAKQPMAGPSLPAPAEAEETVSVEVAKAKRKHAGGAVMSEARKITRATKRRGKPKAAKPFKGAAREMVMRNFIEHDLPLDGSGRTAALERRIFDLAKEVHGELGDSTAGKWLVAWKREYLANPEGIAREFLEAGQGAAEKTKGA